MEDIDRKIQLDRNLEELQKEKSIYERLVKKQDVTEALLDLFNIHEQMYNKALRHSKDTDKDSQYKNILNFIDYLRTCIKESPERLEEIEELITDVDKGDLMGDWERAYWPLFGEGRKKKERERLEKKLQKALYEFKFHPSSFTPTQKET
jgi:hypothetical protein